MARVGRPKYGVHVYYYGAKDRKTWYGTVEARDRAYTSAKRQAEANFGKAVKKAEDVKYAKKIARS